MKNEYNSKNFQNFHAFAIIFSFYSFLYALLTTFVWAELGEEKSNIERYLWRLYTHLFWHLIGNSAHS